jgi:hypothetical protein
MTVIDSPRSELVSTASLVFEISKGHIVGDVDGPSLGHEVVIDSLLNPNPKESESLRLFASQELHTHATIFVCALRRYL